MNGQPGTIVDPVPAAEPVALPRAPLSAGGTA
jgi:hypothetical protein